MLILPILTALIQNYGVRGFTWQFQAAMKVYIKTNKRQQQISERFTDCSETRGHFSWKFQNVEGVSALPKEIFKVSSSRQSIWSPNNRKYYLCEGGFCFLCSFESQRTMSGCPEGLAWFTEPGASRLYVGVWPPMLKWYHISQQVTYMA